MFTEVHYWVDKMGHTKHGPVMPRILETSQWGWIMWKDMFVPELLLGEMRPPRHGDNSYSTEYSYFLHLNTMN